MTTMSALPPIVDADTWRSDVERLREREKAATRELDAIAAQRRRLPMVKLPYYELDGAEGPVSLVDMFDGGTQLITYHHMWSPGAKWQCGGCTWYSSQFRSMDFLRQWDARFVVVTQGPIDQALAYRHKLGNQLDWYSTADSSFGTDVDFPSGSEFGLNVFLRDGDDVYRTWFTSQRGIEQLSYLWPLLDVLPRGRQEYWEDSPSGWPQGDAYVKWPPPAEIAETFGPSSTTRSAP